MRKPAVIFLSSLTFLLPCSSIFSDSSDDPSTSYEEDNNPIPVDTEKSESPTPGSPSSSEQTKTKIVSKQGSTSSKPVTFLSASTPYQPFTGKVIKNKVRIRQQPRLDSPIVKELNQGEMFIVIDESEDFYAIQPPTGTKGFVHRTYVLDGVVEGNRVNVRLEPDVDAPVIAQMNGGEKVDGKISTLNNKWLEIDPPASTRFFIAKDYVIKLGDASFMAKAERRRDEVNLLLNSTYLSSQKELQKSFPEIKLDDIYSNYNKVISEYPDFPDQVARARELLGKLQDDYLQKKIPFLEAKAKMSQQELNEQMKTQQQKLAQLEQQLQREKEKTTKLNNRPSSSSDVANANNSGISDKMSAWLPQEQTLYNNWAEQNNNGSKDDFYHDQRQNAVAIKGIVEPFTRSIKNKPGDYIIMNQSSHLPIAFVYSTQVNLQDKVGQEITVYGVPRSNNNFAFPAYFVLSIE